MKLYPNALLRIGGEAYHHLAQLQASDAAHTVDALLEAREAEVQARQTLAEALFEVVKGHADETVAKKLINLKRAIFNGKDLSDAKLDYVRENLPDASPLEAMCQKIQARRQAEQQARAQYDADIQASRECLRHTAELPNLDLGLVLSSQSLLRQIKNYARTPVAKFKKKHYKTELSLIKYLSRTCAKTSPFSTFTHLAMAKIGDTSAQDQSRPKTIHHIRLNNALIAYLVELLPRHSAYRDQIHVRPNPTLTRAEDHYLFLTNDRNIESFQRIPLNPVLDLLWSLAGAAEGGVGFADLRTQAGESIDAPSDALTAYIAQLLGYGFLEYNLPVSGLDPNWDKPFIQWLNTLDPTTPFRDELAQTIRDIRLRAEAFGGHDAEARIDDLQQAFDQLKACVHRIHEDAGLPEEERAEIPTKPEKADKPAEPESDKEPEKGDEQEEDQPFQHRSQGRFNFKPEQMFFEDVSLDHTFRQSSDELRPMLEKLTACFTQLDLFRSDRGPLADMRAYFDAKGLERLDLLSFYEAYYRDVKKPLAEIDHKLKKTDLDPQSQSDLEAKKSELLSSSRQGRERRDAWTNALRERLPEPENDVIRVTLDHLIETNRAVSCSPDPQDTSYALFCQPFREDGVLNLVVNAAPAGFGKMMSRFLHIFDDTYTETQRAANRRFADRALLVENTDASIFNANLHPPLFDHELWVPGGQNAMPAEAQVGVTDLVVAPDGPDRLGLFHAKTNRPVYIFDLGFQALSGRSELYQMLTHFGPACYVGTGAIQQAAPKPEAKDDEPIINPRIILGDHLVIRRKSWKFPRATLPKRSPGQDDYHFFEACRQFRRRYNLPECGYVSVTNYYELRELNAEERKLVGRDDYKPQFLHFDDPILIRLFEKLVEKTPRALTFTEALPAPHHYPQLDGQGYVHEYVLQWDTGDAS